MDEVYHVVWACLIVCSINLGLTIFLVREWILGIRMRAVVTLQRSAPSWLPTEVKDA